MNLNLTENERVAKDYLMRTIKEGSRQYIGENTDEASLPTWYNKEKFKRGQKYFRDNRFGIMESGFIGLLTVICEPKTLEILMSTGRSSKAKTAKKRYVSTLFMTLSWYESDLAPESKSWQTLKRVRKMHIHASQSVQTKNMEPISQYELAMTPFAFMGYAFIRPHYFGIQHNCAEDREAFIHFWAVISHMIGVEDHFNMCLHPLPVVEIITLLEMQYIFTPFLHIETPLYRQMISAIVDGIADFLPNMTYDTQMFRVRRVAGVTGYQCNTNAKKDKLCRQIFDKDELDFFSKFTVNRYGFDYTKFIITSDTICPTTSRANGLILNDSNGRIIDCKNNNLNEFKLFYQNDSKFQELGLLDKFRVQSIYFISRFYQSFIGWHILEMIVTMKIYLMKRFYDQSEKTN